MAVANRAITRRGIAGDSSACAIEILARRDLPLDVVKRHVADPVAGADDDRLVELVHTESAT